MNEEKKFKYLETLTLNQDPFENIFGSVFFFFCTVGLDNNPSVGQFVCARKTVINGLAYRGLLNQDCEDDRATVLNSLLSCLIPSSVSSPSPSTIHNREITDHVLYICCSYCNLWCFVC